MQQCVRWASVIATPRLWNGFLFSCLPGEERAALLLFLGTFLELPRDPLGAGLAPDQVVVDPMLARERSGAAVPRIKPVEQDPEANAQRSESEICSHG